MTDTERADTIIRLMGEIKDRREWGRIGIEYGVCLRRLLPDYNKRHRDLEEQMVIFGQYRPPVEKETLSERFPSICGRCCYAREKHIEAIEFSKSHKA